MKIKCLWCNDIIENNELHDMKFCKCGKTMLDYHPIWPRIGFERKDDKDMYEVIEK